MSWHIFLSTMWWHSTSKNSMDIDNFYAHSTDSPDKSDWQLLEDHLRGVADLAEDFAAAFWAMD